MWVLMRDGERQSFFPCPRFAIELQDASCKNGERAEALGVLAPIGIYLRRFVGADGCGVLAGVSGGLRQIRRPFYVNPVVQRGLTVQNKRSVIPCGGGVRDGGH
jgi:hypothetical protein